MKSITSIQLSQLLKASANIQLTVVRESYEHAGFNIGGELIPLSQIIKHPGKVEKKSL